MKTNPIMDLNGEPFADHEKALFVCDVLRQETGVRYLVDRDEHNIGYVVLRDEFDYRAAAPETKTNGPNNVDPREDPAAQAFPPLVLRAALRTTLPFHLPFMLLGFYLFIDTVAALSLGLAVLGIGTLPRVIDPNWLVTGFRIIGFLLLASSAWSVFMPWLSSRYIVSAEGIAMEHGIIARNVNQIRYRDIRSVGLKQGIIDRLLNVGTVEFATAGTDAVDVSFAGVARPSAVRDYVKKIMDDKL